LRSAERCVWRQEYIDGACVLADSDGDKIFSTFDTRDLDKSQPKMDCGTHIITGGTGKISMDRGRRRALCASNALMHRPMGSGHITGVSTSHLR
jgi:hypothetical protein